MPGWSDRVRIQPGDGGYAYVPGELLVDVSNPDDVDTIADLLGCVPCAEHGNTEEGAEDPKSESDNYTKNNEDEEDCCDFSENAQDAFGYVRLSYNGDVPGAVRRLRAAGLTAQPNHVFFADGRRRYQANPVYADPVYADPVYADPVYADPVYADPVYADPVYADPVYADPVYADRARRHGGRPGGCSCHTSHCGDKDPCTCKRSSGAGSLVDPNPILAGEFYSDAAARRYQLTGVRPTNAVPTYPPAGTELPGLPAWGSAAVRVAVIDTGWPENPHALDNRYPSQTVTANSPDGASVGDDIPDSTIVDGYMDPAAGHGVFIAGLINQYTPTAAVEVFGALSTFGDGDEETIAAAIDALVSAAMPPHILSLSFGTYAPEQPDRLAMSIASAIEAGIVVVASAGNDGTSRKSYPGAYEGVVSVGALDVDGRPAPFSNWGEWVRACAPGVDVASSFWGFKSKAPNNDQLGADCYEGWALWSGTSFAAPIVAAYLAQTIERGFSGADAVEMAIDNPRLVRLPCYGTVVNPPSVLRAL